MMMVVYKNDMAVEITSDKELSDAQIEAIGDKTDEIFAKYMGYVKDTLEATFVDTPVTVLVYETEAIG